MSFCRFKLSREYNIASLMCSVPLCVIVYEIPARNNLKSFERPKAVAKMRVKNARRNDGVLRVKKKEH